jgi:hypothetical protein
LRLKIGISGWPFSDQPGGGAERFLFRKRNHAVFAAGFRMIHAPSLAFRKIKNHPERGMGKKQEESGYRSGAKPPQNG